MESNDILKGKIDLVKSLITNNEPFFNKDWVLKNMMGLSDEDVGLMEEQIRHERIMKQRNVKLNKIVNEIYKK